MTSFDVEFTAYVTDLEGVEAGQMSDLLMIGQTMDVTGITNEELISNYENLDLDMLEEVEAAEVTEFVNRNGHSFLMATGKVDDFEEDLSNVYFAMTMFEEVMVIVAFIDIEDGHDFDRSLLEAVLQSYSEYDTDRENAFYPYEEEPYNEEWEGEMFGFKNNMYETNLDYGNAGFFPPYVEDETEEWFWDEDWSQEYLELLLAYGYYHLESEDDSNPLCGIKVFSGGYSDNFKSDLQKLIALQKVFPSHYIEGISAQGTLVGEEFAFKSYAVTSSAFEFSKHVLYITEINGEMVFFLSYFREIPSAELDMKMKEVIKTFDYMQ